MRGDAPYLVSHLDELDAVPVAHGLVWRPIRRRFDIRGFGVNAYTAEEVGGQVVEEHTEARLRHSELYVVVRGHATFTLDGAEVDAPAVTFVHVPDPQVRRVAVSRTPDTVVLALGGRPGKPFRVSAWEAMFAAIPATRAERWDEAIRLHEEALAERPDHPLLLYNLACMEARGGRHLDALLHLQRAAELDPQAAVWARRDSDFAAIRHEQGFPVAAAAPQPLEDETRQAAPARPDGWRAARLEQLPERDGWIPVRAELGFEPVGIGVWIGHAAGDEVIEDHDERDSGHEELYLVLSGRARIVVGGRQLDAPAGTLVAVDPRQRRGAVAVEPETAILAVGAQPGVAFTPSEWETRLLRGGPVAGEPSPVDESA